MKLHAVSAV